MARLRINGKHKGGNLECFAHVFAIARRFLASACACSHFTYFNFHRFCSHIRAYISRIRAAHAKNEQALRLRRKVRRLFARVWNERSRTSTRTHSSIRRQNKRWCARASTTTAHAFWFVDGGFFVLFPACIAAFASCARYRFAQIRCDRSCSQQIASSFRLALALSML